MIKTTREFAPSDRYRYDFGLCSTDNGFAQLDTKQDFRHFGMWANPFKRIVFSYVEGDCTTVEHDTDEELADTLRSYFGCEITECIGIDCGLSGEHSEGMKERFRALGFAKQLH